jgi:hypothetical protein
MSGKNAETVEISRVSSFEILTRYLLIVFVILNKEFKKNLLKITIVFLCFFYFDLLNN